MQAQPFSAKTLPPFYDFKLQGNKEKIIKVSRQKYSTKKEEIEKLIENT